MSKKEEICHKLTKQHNNNVEENKNEREGEKLLIFMGLKVFKKMRIF